MTIFEWLKSNDDHTKMMGLKIKDKFEKYWNVFRGILYVATVLDLRYKMKLIEYYFPQIYGSDCSDFEIDRIHAFVLTR